jgi:hypothetical protein
MKNLLKLGLPLVLALVSVAPQVASADQPGKHPAYLHALTDLRAARYNLRHRKGDADMKWEEGKAIADVDAAIASIKEASIDDGKNIDDHPADDAKVPDYAGRLHKALDNLKSAHEDINKEEDNDYAKHLKKRALENISSAERRTREALCNSGDKPFCK